MRLLYPQQHQVCKHYGIGASSFTVMEKRTWEKYKTGEYITPVNELYFIMEGKFTLSFDNERIYTLEKGQFYFLPSDVCFSYVPEEDTTLLIIRISEIIQFCEEYSLTNLNSEKMAIEHDFNPLTVNIRIENYHHCLISYLDDGLRCCHFQELKLKELFYLLRAYYEKELLVGLFYPILSDKYKFYDFVIRNYSSVKTVKELAALSMYSLSGFEKEFKKVFGMPAYRWILDKKIKKVHQEIVSTTKPLKIVADNCGFSSVTQLNDFCKKHLGRAPGKLRKNITE